MNPQFSQPKGAVSKETNKDSIARKFGCKKSEVLYAKTGAGLSGYKVIYDKVSQRSYALPSNLPAGATITSMTDGILVHNTGTVDLGALAVLRGEFVTLVENFTSGFTIKVRNEIVSDGTYLYRWAGSLPKVVSAGTTVDNTGGVSASAWVRSDQRTIGTVKRQLQQSYTMAELVAKTDIQLGDSFLCSDRAFGVYDVVSSVAYPPNGYSNVVSTVNSGLVFRLRVVANTIDLEQIGGKPLIWGTQEIDCKQALQEAFYLLLDSESATVDLKSNKWLLSSYVFNDVKQRRKIVGNNAIIYGMPDDGVTNYDYLVSTAWNYQDIEGVTFDCQWNPRYACCLRITHGYGRYDNLTIRKARCAIQVGKSGESQVSLSEFMFTQLRTEECAKVAIVHGLYSVLNISDSIVACGEGAFWKTYDCTGFTIYGGRVFLMKCGGNSNVINLDNPYVYCANTTVSGTPYIGSFNAVQCDFEFRTRFCIVNDTTTVYQDYNQAVVLDSCRIGVFASLDSRALNFFESNVGYRGQLRIKNTDLLFDTTVSLPPIKAGGHTIVDIDYDSIYIPNFRGPKMVSFAGYPPVLPVGIVFQNNVGADTPLSGNQFVNFSNPIIGLDSDSSLLSSNWNSSTKKFELPPGGLSDVTVTVRLTLKDPATAPVTALVEYNNGTAIGLAFGTIPVGSKDLLITGRIRDLRDTAQIYCITSSTAAYTLSNTGAYDSTMTIEASIRPPKTKS